MHGREGEAVMVIVLACVIVLVYKLDMMYKAQCRLLNHVLCSA
jgi:hypothetical protein